MASLIDIYKASKYATAPDKGKDKTPIGVELPFDGSKDLMKSDLSKPRKGALGQGTGGYDNKKVYSTSIKNK